MKKQIFTLIVAAMATFTLNAQSVGSAAPDFTVSLANSMDDFTLSDQSGKVVLIFFFGNTCPACINASPGVKSEILEMYNSNPEFVAIGIDTWDGSESLVNSFKNQTGLDIPLGLNGGSIASNYGSTYDRLLVVDKEGILRHKTSNSASSDLSTVKSVISQYVGGTASISNNNYSKSLTIYPNPISDIATIEFNEESYNSFNISIFDLSGRNLFNDVYNTNSELRKDIDFSSFPEGAYLLKLSNKETVAVKRFTISR